ncbi:AaceriAFR702Wp [[Ashbya] aceris (nom. inval.)]|nr:AaceriAFR702Wp [[Ashbya] aceris (nom. inval.)]
MSDKYQDRIGTFLQIPNVGKGQLKYIGPVEGKQGLFVGVDLLANIGKNDGTFRGKRYFETEYPQSGLFIHLQKVAWLLDQAGEAHSSSTTAVGHNTQAHPQAHPQQQRLSIMTSNSTLATTGSTGAAKTRNRASSVIYRSPTPRRVVSRAASMMSRRTLASDQSDFFSDSMEAEDRPHSENEDDVEEGEDADDAETESADNRNSIFMTPKYFKRQSISYESKIKQQQEEILHYKRLLDDQRIVLEEIQPAIDDYEEKLRYLEAEKQRLQNTLQSEREHLAKQKQYFESEHEQLLSVVDELHKEIKENEERMLRQRRRQTIIMEDEGQVLEMDTLKSENDRLKRQLEELLRQCQEQEQLKAEWQKERARLQTDNQSLNDGYSTLSKELADTQRKLDDIVQGQSLKSGTDLASYQSEIEYLRRELEEARSLIGVKSPAPSHRHRDELGLQPKLPNESLPLFDGNKNKDAAAGRLLWCALCEKDGHTAFECTEVAF